MKFNSKVTWGLAWTGLALVLAVPSADFLTGRLGGGNTAAVLTSDVEPVKTAPAVTTVKTANGISIVPAGSPPPAAASDPVDKRLSSGKKLPDYITDDEPPAQTATPASTTAPAETQVAALPAPVVAPTPFPSWARPRATSAAAIPTVTAPIRTTSPEPVVIVDETTLTGSITPKASGPVPPAPIVDDSDNWDTETLRQYLERRGILEGSDTRSSARVTERSNSYDPDGFYLDEGPNGDRVTRETRQQRLDRLFEESGDQPRSFTLF